MIKNFFGHIKIIRNEIISQSNRFFSEEPVRKRLKHKVPQKRYYRNLFLLSIFQNSHHIIFDRASKLLNILRNEEFEKLKAGRQYPKFRPGDSISVEKLPYITATETHTVKGVVIAITKRASDTAVRILNVIYSYLVRHGRYPSGNYSLIPNNNRMSKELRCIDV